MPSSTDFVHFKGITHAAFNVRKSDTFTTVDIAVTDESNGSYKVYLFCENDAEVDTIMAAMAAASREHFGNAEPEADWDAIASEMDLDHQMEDARGI